MYLINNYNKLKQLSALLWQLNATDNPNNKTKYMFPVQQTLVDEIGYMQIESYMVKFTQDKTSEIRQLVLAMEPDISPESLDQRISYLITNEEVDFLTLLENLDIKIRDKQYLVDNGYMIEIL